MTTESPPPTPLSDHTQPSETPPNDENVKKSRMKLVQNPKYKNLPSLLRYYEHRANYYKNKYPVPFYLTTGSYFLFSLVVPLKLYFRTGKLRWINAWTFAFFWGWVCFSRDFFANVRGVRRWFLPDDFYEYVEEDRIEEWKEEKLREWREQKVTQQEHHQDTRQSAEQL